MESIAYTGLGRIHERKNQLNEAERAFKLALEVAESLDAPYMRADPLRNLD